LYNKYKMFYYNLPCRLISEDGLNGLRKLGLSNLKNSREYIVHDNGLPDGNRFYKLGLNAIKDVKRLVNTCSIPCYPMLVIHAPGAVITKHTDDPNKRNCTILQPLYPITGYTNTIFYDSINSLTGHIADFQNFMPKIFNTQAVHSVENTSLVYRFNLQLCFSEPIAVVVQLWETNTLFADLLRF
jgi:hypothetical protein